MAQKASGTVLCRACDAGGGGNDNSLDLGLKSQEINTVLRYYFPLFWWSNSKFKKNAIMPL
jgi:hypothetical protein